MALTDRQRKILKDGLADGKVADEIADAIDSGSNDQGVAVADLGAAAAAGTDAALIDNLNAKVDELLGSLRAAGIIA